MAITRELYIQLEYSRKATLNAKKHAENSTKRFNEKTYTMRRNFVLIWYKLKQLFVQNFYL